MQQFYVLGTLSGDWHAHRRPWTQDGILAISVWVFDVAMRRSRKVASIAALATILVLRLAGKVRKTLSSFFVMLLHLKTYFYFSQMQV